MLGVSAVVSAPAAVRVNRFRAYQVWGGRVRHRSSSIEGSEDRWPRLPHPLLAPPSPVHTHYENLKVACNAPPEVIRAAYRVLAQRYHPDMNSSPDASRIMKILNVSYAVLSDPQRRAAHDSWIENQLIKEALDEAAADTRQAAPDAPRARQQQSAASPAPARAPTPATRKRLSNILGPIGAVGLLLIIGFQLTASKRAGQQTPIVSYQQPVAANGGERSWPDIARAADFASLSPAEKDSVREAYFERVIAPKVSLGELAAARARFYRDSGHSRPAPSPPAAAAPQAEQSRKAPSYIPFNGVLDPPSRPRPSAAASLEEKSAPRTFSFEEAQRAPGQAQTAPAWSPNGKPWPTRAAYLDGFHRRAASGRSTLTIDNTSGGADVYVKLCTASADRCDGLRHVFIPLGARFTMGTIAPGVYDIRYRALGDGALAKSEPIELEQIEDARGIRYSTVRLTLYRVSGGNTTFGSLPEDKF